MILQGRIRGTYGINAKPLEPSPPEHAPDPLPLPGVTRASLRPKPAAKVNPDDEPSEAPQHAAHSQRHARAHATAGADAPLEQPSSPLATRASAAVEGESALLALSSLWCVRVNGTGQNRLQWEDHCQTCRSWLGRRNHGQQGIVDQ